MAAERIPNPNFDKYHKDFTCPTCGRPPEYGGYAYKQWRLRVINHTDHRGNMVHKYPPGKTMKATTAKKVEGHSALSSAQDAASQIVPQQPAKPTKDQHGGDLPEEVPNDSGFGTKREYPLAPCPHCPARFFSMDSIAPHIAERHPDKNG